MASDDEVQKLCAGEDDKATESEIQPEVPQDPPPGTLQPPETAPDAQQRPAEETPPDLPRTPPPDTQYVSVSVIPQRDPPEICVQDTPTQQEKLVLTDVDPERDAGRADERAHIDTDSSVHTPKPTKSGGNEDQGPHNWRKRLKHIHSPVLEDITLLGETCSNDGNHIPSEAAEVIRRKSSREDRLEESSKIREKMRAKRDAKKGPVVAKHTFLLPFNQVSGSSSPSSIKRRHSFHNHLDSPFTRQVVKQVSPGLQRRKATSGSTGNVSKLQITERKNSLMLPLNTNRRAASPNLIGDLSALGAKSLRKRVDKVMKARLYFLQQTGPNSFLIGGDSPDHKYRIIIGPQRCNCGRGPHCVHVLFVMLRVFQVPENDPCVWSKMLKNYEVETLFKNFHARRTSRIEELMKKKSKPSRKRSQEENHDNEDTQSTTTEETESGDKDEDEETCPICLLEMVEGESLVQCDNGCQNKLHHHCIDVWFEECRRQNEALNCPLCRAKWRKQDSGSESLVPPGELPVPPNTRASSPQPHDQDLPLPHAEPIPPEHSETAHRWIPVIGEDITRCLFSKNWAVREIALQQLSRVAVGALLLGVGEGRSGVVLSPVRQATTHTMLECCCQVLAFVCGDPVYKVFVAALRTLRTVLSYMPCRDEHQQSRLQTLMTPVIQTILWKCADSNRRTSQLSISALQELAKGQNGELALGKEIVNPGQKGLGGLEYLIDSVTQSEPEREAPWQGLLGRLYMLDRLLEEYVSEFTVENNEHNDHAEATILDEAQNYDRVFSILNFCILLMSHTHSKVSKMARRVFFLLAKLQAHSRTVLKDISDLLDDVNVNIRTHLRRKLWRVAEEYSHLQRDKLDESGIIQFEPDGPVPPCSTPIISESSTPRSTSPVTIDGTMAPGHPNITVHNIMMGQLVGSTAPPNSPNQKLKGKRSCSVHDDNLSVDDVNVLERVVAPDVIFRVHSPSYRLSPQGQSSSDLDRSPRIHHRESRVEVADACVATSPRLRQRNVRRSLTTVVVNNDEDNGSAEDNKDEEDQELCEESNQLPHNTSADVKDCCTPDTLKPLLFNDEAAYNTVDESDIHPEGIQIIHKRKNRTPRLKRKQRLSDERSRSTAESKTAVIESSDALNVETSDITVDTELPIDTVDCDATVPSPPHDLVKQSTHTETQTQDTREDAGTQTDDDDLSSTNATINSTHAALYTEDLSDITLSHSGDDKVTFRDEIARASPSHSGHTDEACPCKEEVEREEAKALVEALERSTISQEDLPRVPGLSRTDSSHTLTIHIQDQENGSETSEYKEDIHWKRGCVLGTGAFSTCYQARDAKTGTLMAVKQISYCRNSLSEQEKVVDAVREEILMMAKLNHPNIVRILGATQQGCHFFMFVEWMPGGSVAYLLDRYGLFTEQVQTSYTFQILHGLAYLHDNQILHRDLKGANLLVDSTGQRVRIGDFGASARLATRQTGAGEFQGQLLGTIAFMAPEVLRGESYGRSCDIWSVGCVMIELATGKPPWGAHDISNHLALIFKIASSCSPPPIPDNITPAVKDMMLRCLEPSREDRPPAKDLLKHPLFTMYTKR